MSEVTQQRGKSQDSTLIPNSEPPGHPWRAQATNRPISSLVFRGTTSHKHSL